MAFSQDLVKGSVVPIVLALLRDRRMYGYEMVKQVNARTGGKLEWREGTLYPTLHRLEGDGLIKAEWEPGEGERMRKYYEITGKGRKELERRAGEWKEFSTAVNLLLEGGAR